MGLQDDIAYVGILFGSIFFSKFFRLIPPEEVDGVKTYSRRRAVSTGAGLIIAWLVSGVHTLHLIVQILGNILILKCVPISRCHLFSFAWCFSYLTFFRLSARFGLPEPPPHTNAIILILTLKLVGVSFEVHDDSISDKDNKVEPSVTDIFHYCLGHIGLITGPYYKYQTWRGLFSDPWNPAVESAANWGLCETAALRRARNVPLYVALFLASGYMFPLSVVETKEWQESSSLLWKLFYMMPIFFNFRMRIYAGFILSECACIMAGLGAYPERCQPRPGQGPSKPEELVKVEAGEVVNFETVHNIDEWGSDFVPSMREALRCWNMTVQHWLVFIVYKRFPIKRLRTIMVMLVSSVWHGVHPGYYLSLGSVPLCLIVEDYYRRKVRSKLSEQGQRVYDIFGWFVRMRWFDYLGMGFLLLRIDSTLQYWTSVYFAGHLSLPCLGIIGVVIVGPIMDILYKKKE